MQAHESDNGEYPAVLREAGSMPYIAQGAYGDVELMLNNIAVEAPNLIQAGVHALGHSANHSHLPRCLASPKTLMLKLRHG